MADAVASKTSRGAELAAVVGHEVRIGAWLILMARVASPKQIADELGGGVRTQDVDYHVKVLEKAGVVEEVGKEKVRGATQHFYRTTQRPFLDADGTAELTEEVAERNGMSVLMLLLADAVVAANAGTLVRRRDHHLARAPGVVDEQGWQDINAAAARFLDEALKIQGESAVRLQESGDEEIPMTAAVTAFETPDARHYRPA